MDFLRQLKEQADNKNPYVFLTGDRLEHVKQKWADWKIAGKVISDNHSYHPATIRISG